MSLPDFLSTSNTFRQWLATTNNLISHVSNTSVYVLASQNATPDTTTGNVSLNGTMTIATITANGTVSANVFSGNGVSLTSLNASALDSGTVPLGRLTSANSSANGVVDTTTQTFAGRKTFANLVTLTGATGGGIYSEDNAYIDLENTSNTKALVYPEFIQLNHTYPNPGGPGMVVDIANINSTALQLDIYSILATLNGSGLILDDREYDKFRANAATLFIGNTTANGVLTKTSFLLINSTSNTTIAPGTLTIGTATINSTNYTQTANNSTYAFGKSEGALNVNSAVSANNSTYAFGKSEGALNVNSAVSANNSTYAFGKSEGALNVNSATTATTANNSTYAFGKSENQLNVNSAATATTANNSTYAFGKSENQLNVNSAAVANNSTYAFGKTEGALNVNSAVLANNSTYAFGKSEADLNVNSAAVANNATHAFGKTEGNLNVNNAVYLTAKLPLSNTSISTVGNVTSTTTGQDWFRLSWSAGLVSGGVLSDNGDGSVTLTDAEVALRVDTVDHANLAVYFIAGTSLSLTNNDVNYIYANYNGGTPIFSVTTAPSDINEYTHTLLYVIGRRGTELTGLDASSQNVSIGTKVDQLLINSDNYVYGPYYHAAGGSIIGNPADANLSLTAGKFYYGLSPVTHPAFDTSVAGTANVNVFRYYYNRSAWTFTSNVKAINLTQYDNNGTLTALGNKSYRTDYVYLVPDGLVGAPYLAVVYGNTQYSSLAAAVQAPVPSSLPPEMDGLAILVGRVTAQEGVAGITVATFSTSLISSPVSTHNALAGLQGGLTGEYYHLSANGYTALSVLDTSNAPANGTLLIGNGSAFTVNTLTNGTNIVITDALGSITIATDANVLSTTSTTGINASALSTGTVADARLSGTYTNITANNATYAFGKSEAALNVNSASTANNSTYAFGKSEAALNVNSATTATTANNSTYAFGKSEGALNVNSATTATTANNSTYAFGKSESALNVNSAATANNSTYAFGKSEGSLNVNSATTATTANNSTYAFGKSEGALNVNSAVSANNTTYAFGKLEGALNVNNALTANQSTYLAGAAVTGNSTALTVGANVYVSQSTVFVGNATANGVLTSLQFAVANATNTATLTPISLTIGTQVANTLGFYAGVNVYANTTTLFLGNATANGVLTSLQFAVANATNTATLTPISLTIGTQIANTTGFYAGANVYANTTTVFFGNATVNSVHTATSLSVANATNTATMTPISLTIGTQVANTIGFYAGANVYANTTTLFFGNATVNSVHTATSLTFGNSTSNTTIAPGNVGIGKAASYALDVNGTARVYRVVNDLVTLTDGASVALDASLGKVFRLAAGGNRTISAPSNALDGQSIIIEHYANSADRTLSLTTGSSGAFRFGTDITSLTATTSGKTDYIGCLYNGTDSRWDVVAVMKGF